MNILTTRHARGYFLVTDNDTGKVLDEGETLQCRHCQGHWKVRPGSGIERGWCWRCNGPTHAQCDRCVPWEMELEIAEQRLSLASALHRIRGL